MVEVDSYLQKLPDAQRAELEHVRSIVLSELPEAKEVITYGMPGFKYKNKYLIAYSAFAKHMSVFPGAGAVQKLADKLTRYKVSTGTIQFTLEDPLPEELLRTIIQTRVQEIES